jgi:hypothetical protein
MPKKAKEPVETDETIETPPETEPLTKKGYKPRKFSEDHLAKLAVARQKAREAQVRNAALRKMERENAAYEKKLEEQKRKDEIKKKNEEIKKGLDAIPNEPVNEPPAIRPKAQAIQDFSSSDEEEKVKEKVEKKVEFEKDVKREKKKKTKKPVVIIEDSDSSSDEEQQVIYVKKKNKAKKEQKEPVPMDRNHEKEPVPMDRNHQNPQMYPVPMNRMYGINPFHQFNNFKRY